MANILAVDDEKAILNMIGNVLVKDSHTVTKIDDPTKIEMDKLSHFDLILLDVMMPGIDGFEYMPIKTVWGIGYKWEE